MIDRGFGALADDLSIIVLRQSNTTQSVADMVNFAGKLRLNGLGAYSSEQLVGNVESKVLPEPEQYSRR